jgi:hypothetical protein
MIAPPRDFSPGLFGRRAVLPADPLAFRKSRKGCEPRRRRFGGRDIQGNGLHLYRLFGDANGVGVVDPTDLNFFRNTFNVNNTQAAYLAFLDANNDGVVDPTDLNQFRTRFNTNVF